MKKIIFYTLLCLIFKANATTQEFQSIAGTFQMADDSNYKLEATYQTKEGTPVITASFSDASKAEPTYYTNVFATAIGLSAPEEGCKGVWSLHTDPKEVIRFTTSTPLTGQFLIRVNCAVLGDVGENMILLAGTKQRNFPLSSENVGPGFREAVSTVLVDLENVNSLMFIPPNPHQAGNGDFRLFGVRLDRIDIISFNDELITSVADAAPRAGDQASESKTPWNKRLEGFGQKAGKDIGAQLGRFGKFLKKAGQDSGL